MVEHCLASHVLRRRQSEYVAEVWREVEPPTNHEIALIESRQISQQRGDFEVRHPSSNFGR